MERGKRTPLPPDVQAEIRSDDKVFAAGLAYVRERAANEAEGVFGPGSMAWRIYREPFVLLGAIRAVALQMAHPAVASGVDQHSNFKSDVYGRARRTYTVLYHLVFGSLQEAFGAARRLHAMHNRVRGLTEADAPSPAAGRPYRANDPDLLLWVQATLIDTSVLLYEMLVQPLTPEEKRRFYEESRLTAVLMGIPPASYPPTLEAFYRYYEDTLTGTDLALGRAGREQVEALLSPAPVPAKLGAAWAAGLLPPRFRQAFDLPWDGRAQRRYRRMVRALRTLVRLVPAPLRAVPAYHQARLRVARASGAPRPLLGRILNRVHQKVELPLSIRSIG